MPFFVRGAKKTKANTRGSAKSTTYVPSKKPKIDDDEEISSESDVEDGDSVKGSEDGRHDEEEAAIELVKYNN